MTYLAHVGSFNLSTAAAGNTQEISDCGFEPKIVMFWWGGGHSTGDEVAGANYSFGFGAAISSSSRFCIVNNGEDAVAASNNTRVYYTTDCIRTYTTPDTLNGAMDFQSMDADGFTLIIDDQFTVDYRISYLALGGTDLTNVFIGSQAEPVSTGNYNVGGVGFQPDALITVFSGKTAANSLSANMHFGLGWATGSSNQGVISSYSLDNQATIDTFAYGYNGECVAGFNGYRESFVSFGTDGFTLNHLDGAIALLYAFICLKGGRYSVGDLTTRTDGNDISETVNFTPAAVLFASANRALNTQDAATAHARLSIGAASSTSARSCAAISDEDNLADSETAYANYDSAVYANIADDAVVALMDLKSIENTGFTCVMDDTEASACWVTYLAMGAEAHIPRHGFILGNDPGTL